MDAPVAAPEAVPSAKAKDLEAEFLRVLAKIRRNVPADVSDEEIEAEIAQATAEARRETRARRR